MKPSGLSSKKSADETNQTIVTSASKSGKKEPPVELMNRLAKGEKAEIKKKDMLKLTNKNYELLPEVQRKREQERKKEEYKNRMKQVKEMEEKRQELLRQKRNQM